MTVEARAAMAHGVRAALPGLGPEGRLWLLAVADVHNRRVGFAPIDDGSLVPSLRLLLGPKGNESGQVLELAIP